MHPPERRRLRRRAKKSPPGRKPSTKGRARPPLLAGARARRISATDAARTFSDLLNRVQYRGETVVVERGGRPICEIMPAMPLRFTLTELVALLRSAPKPDAGYWDTLEKITRHQPLAEPSPWAR